MFYIKTELLSQTHTKKKQYKSFQGSGYWVGLLPLHALTCSSARPKHNYNRQDENFLMENKQNVKLKQNAQTWITDKMLVQSSNNR